MKAEKTPLTAEEFNAWGNANSAALRAKEEERQRRIENLVIRSVSSEMEHGMSLNDAGDWVLLALNYGGHGGFVLRPEDVRRVLQDIGWTPKARRKS